MTDNKLVLIPDRPEFSVPEKSCIERCLLEIGLLGAPFDFYGSPCFQPGPNFFELVEFFTSQPPSMVFIEISTPTNRIEFLGGANTQDPSCRGCGCVLSDWIDCLDGWYEHGNSEWSCSVCGQTSLIWDLDWKHTAGFAKFKISLWHIHEGEAIPSLKLLAALREVSGGDWNFFHFRI